jgi:hypothetical protein
MDLTECIEARKKLQTERDDALFALQALCEEVNAMHTGHLYTLADCLKGAKEWRAVCECGYSLYDHQLGRCMCPVERDVIELSAWSHNTEVILRQKDGGKRTFWMLNGEFGMNTRLPAEVLFDWLKTVAKPPYIAPSEFPYAIPGEPIDGRTDAGATVTNSPIDICCPKCSAAPTAKCLEKTLWGSKLIETFHDERIAAAGLPDVGLQQDCSGIEIGTHD